MTPDIDIIAHLDKMEERLLGVIAESRADVKTVLVDQAATKARVDSLESRAKWVERIFGSAFAALVGTFIAHVRGH